MINTGGLISPLPRLRFPFLGPFANPIITFHTHCFPHQKLSGSSCPWPQTKPSFQDQFPGAHPLPESSPMVPVPWLVLQPDHAFAVPGADPEFPPRLLFWRLPRPSPIGLKSHLTPSPKAVTPSTLMLPWSLQPPANILQCPPETTFMAPARRPRCCFGSGLAACFVGSVCVCVRKYSVVSDSLQHYVL